MVTCAITQYILIVCRIQATWRGYVVRCWYKKLRETVPPKDPKLRQKYYEDKVSSVMYIYANLHASATVSRISNINFMYLYNFFISNYHTQNVVISIDFHY